MRGHARGALQSLRFSCLNRGVATGGTSSYGIGCSSRVPHRPDYRPYWLGDPTMPLAFPRLCGLCQTDFADHRLSNQSSPLFEFRLPLESYPAKPSQSAAADQLLSWASAPFSTSGIEGPLTRVRPPASFRLQGLATLLAAYSLRIRAGFVSHRQRSWDSPFGAFPSRKGIRGVTTRMHPPTVSPIGVPAAEAVGRPNGPRFLGFHPSESPWRPDKGLVRRSLDAPLGFALPGYSRENLAQAFTRAPLTRFAPRDDCSSSAPAPQSIDQLSPGPVSSPHRSTTTHGTTLLGSLHRLNP
jgi:hypothetical protein